MHSTPQSLLERLRAHPDNSAWNRFVELYTPVLLRWASHLGLHGNDAADLVQDIFVVLVQKMPEFDYDPARSFRAWLKTVTRNVWKERCRKEARARADALSIEQDFPVPDPAEEFWDREYREWLVRRAFERLRPDFEDTTWRACLMTVLEEKTVATVALALGLSEASVYAARSRVLRRLRAELRGLIDT